jgi:hypothetical protein
MKKLRTIPMRRAITAFLCGLMVFYTIACSYYRTVVKEPEQIPAIAATETNKTMFLHFGEDTYHIQSLYVENNQTAIIEIDTLSRIIPIYNADDRSGRIKARHKGILREMHFYLSPTVNADFGQGKVELPITAFHQVRIVKADEVRSLIIGVIISVTVLSLAFGGVWWGIETLKDTSCPYVYVFDGENYIFQGEIYSGAVLRNLERGDHLALPLLQSSKGEYRMRIANELKERQFVNLAEMQAIRHPEGTQALFDINGAPQLIANPQLPLSAISALGNDASALTAQKDGLVFLFDEEQAEKNSLTLQFKNQPGARHPKLVLQASNSFWVDHLFGRYLEKWGNTYPRWVDRQAAMSYEQRQAQNISQDFPLAVFIKGADGQWQLAGRFPLAGPMARRDMVLPLDPARLEGEMVEVRLETGYRFWEVDYAAIDFSENIGMEVLTLPAKSAKDQNGKSQMKALAQDDKMYLNQLQTGNYTDLRFKAIAPPKGQTQTLFLHTKGYYEHVRDFQGEPKMDELEYFRKPHYFDQFSKEEYRKLPTTYRIELE